MTGRSEYNKKWREENKDKVALWLANNKSKKLDSNAKHRYGISYDEYCKRMELSDTCENCGSNKGKLHYDHDHNTMDFRGVLCNKCNMGLGLLGDNITGILNTLWYLIKYKFKRR